MFCKECGKAIEDDSKFCKHCGKTIISEPNSNQEISLAPVEIISQEKLVKNNICCPLCKHIDSIAKVSAVYSSGVSEGSYSGTAVSFITPLSSNESSSVAFTPVSMGGVNISGLSKRIAPLPEPRYPSQLWFVIFLILACLSLSLIWIMGLTLPFLVIFGALAVWQGVRISNKRKETKEYIPIYEKSMVSWNKLYYCFRDDIVFNPETNEYTSPEKVYDLISNDIEINNSTPQA